MVLSITRLRAKSLWSAFIVLKNSAKIIRKIEEMPGYVAGQTAFRIPFVFWTMTLWESLEKMQEFVGTGEHLKSMKLLPQHCSEAAVFHTEWKEKKFPTIAEALKILNEKGKFSFVQKASENQKKKYIPEEKALLSKLPEGSSEL